MALQGYKALVKAQSSAIAFTDEATTTSDNKTYAITNTAKAIWDYDTAIIVKVGGSPVTGYTLNRLEGTVTFPSATSRVVTVSGAYVVLTTVAEATEFAFDGVLDMGDTTAFQEGERSYKPTLQTATATLTRFYVVDAYFIGVLFDKSVKVIEFYADSEAEPFRVYGLVSSDSVSSSIEGLIGESVSFQITGKMVVEA